MKNKTFARLLVLAVILPLIIGYVFGQDHKKVIVLEHIAIHVMPPSSDDEPAKEFHEAFMKELKKVGKFAMVGPASDRHCTIMHATVKIICGTVNINYTRGYASAIVIVTKQGPDMRLDVSNSTGKTTQEVAEISVKKLLKLFENGDISENK